MLLTRRSLFKGLGLLIAAPAIVKAESLMKIKSIEEQEAEIKDLLVTQSTSFSGFYQSLRFVHPQSPAFYQGIDWSSNVSS